MAFNKHVIGVGIVVVLTLINLEFIIERQLNTGNPASTDPAYVPKRKSFLHHEQDEAKYTIRNADVAVLQPPKIASMTEQETIQSARKEQVSQTCAKYNLTGSFKDFIKSGTRRFIVDEKHKLIYCSVPKIASTSWKRVLLVLKGIMKNTYDLSQPEVNNKVGPKKLDHLRDYEEEDIQRMLKEYTKFLVVRDPFSRVLSAFRNKLAPESDFPRCEIWQKGIGMRILRKYRPHWEAKRPTSKRLITSKGIVRYDLNLADFVKFLVNPLEIYDNEHWSEIHKMCSPCFIKYDVISKLSTLESDASYILRRVHADSVVQFPSSNGSSPTNSSSHAAIASYFKSVPKGDLKKLYQRFKLDFELFGYEKPDIS